MEYVISSQKVNLGEKKGPKGSKFSKLKCDELLIIGSVLKKMSLF